jgi:hypothetical protein
MRRAPVGAGALRTTRDAGAIKSDIREEFRLWGFERDEYEIFPALGAKEALIEFWLNGKKQVLKCSKGEYHADNLVGVLGIIHGLRLAHQRGILEELASAAIAMLPAGPQHRDPYEVLGVRSDADTEVIEAAYKARAKKLHPDVGGDGEAMKEVNEALDRIKTERGLA